MKNWVVDIDYVSKTHVVNNRRITDLRPIGVLSSVSHREEAGFSVLESEVLIFQSIDEHALHSRGRTRYL